MKRHNKSFIMVSPIKTGLFLIMLIGLSLFNLLYLHASKEPARTYHKRALTRLKEGDPVGAHSLLDEALKLDPNHGPSLILRGRVNLISGDFKQARKDFSQALQAKSPKIRSLGHVGLGHVLIRNPKRTSQAIRHYRLAVKIDPTSYEALYDLAEAGYSYSKIAGRRLASEALARLVCLDPLYRNVYRIWRDLILDKSDDEIREVDTRLEAFLADHPDSAAWWVDLARDRFYIGETSRALETLDSLLNANPGYLSPEISLLKARCSLERGDTAGFQSFYEQAISTAEVTGDFTRLFREAELLFYPEAYVKWELCRDNRDRARFLHLIWAQLNPDPLADYNASLVEHYNRLRQAEKNYHLQFPHFPYDTTVSITINPSIMEFIRYGIQKKVVWKNGGTKKRLKNPLKFWFCGDSGFLFDDLKTNKSYDLQPEVQGQLNNMIKAISMQIGSDESIRNTSELYSASFMTSDTGNVEVEFYQAGPPGSGSRPQAEAVVFDTTWQELERLASPVYKVKTDSDSSWLAVHRIELPPGLYWFAVRMLLSEGNRLVDRGLVEIQSFDRGKLDLSRIVLGSLEESGTETHTRMEMEIVPRPSLRFKRGGIIKVYLEVYNLQPDSTGLRSYAESVQVTRVKDDIKKVRKFAGATAKWKRLDADKSSTSLRHSFDRTAATITGPVAEVFTLDTSDIIPGNYRLVIEIQDNGNGNSKQVDCIFVLTE